MNNDTLKIVARLDIPKSVVLIEKDIYKLENKLKSNTLQILAELNVEKSKYLIQSQLDYISNQTKTPVIKVGIGVNKNFEKDTVNGLLNIDKQAKQTAQSVKKVELNDDSSESKLLGIQVDIDLEDKDKSSDAIN